MSGITIRAGTYHNGIYRGENQHLLEVLQRISDLGIRVSNERDSHFYFVRDLKCGDGWIIGMVSRAKKNTTIRTVSDRRNSIESIHNQNIIDMTVMFYMDSENTIIMEEKTRMPRFKTAWALSMLFYQYMEEYDETHRRIYGHYFEVTFDRFKTGGPDEFLDSIKILKKVEVKVNAFGNPYMNKSLETLQRQYMELKADKIVITGKEISKDSDMVHATANLSLDGHIDVRMEGINEGDEPETYTSNKSNDDSYGIENCKEDHERFHEAIKGIISTVRKHHGRS